MNDNKNGCCNYIYIKCGDVLWIIIIINLYATYKPMKAR